MSGRGSTAHPGKRSSRAPLAEYARKRDLKKTPEPPAKLGRTTQRRTFVIQQHAARRLHWDFRLEADGVLKSWAVTKEPTMDSSVRRLAVRVEDHPLAYGGFAGDIPEGSYGAGHVDIWDKGTYEPTGNIASGLDAGKIEFNLHGKKLKGMFALVRMGPAGTKENWLLIKMKDEFARRGKQRRSVATHNPQPTTHAQRATGKSQRIEFTHADKMMFPQAGLTKGDVLHFYEAIADRLIPHLKDRPATLERLPDGLAKPDAPRFWQKNTPSYYPIWIPRVELPSEAGKPVRYVLVNDANVLLCLVNQGAITFHPFLSRVGSLERPDIVLFDLDPGDAPFAHVVTTARKLRGLLEMGGTDSYLKTSGKTGLHVLTPWNQAGGYDEARHWASDVAARLVEALPDLATTERSKAARHQRVYVDVIQNARGHHVVPPYVMRAVPEATISTPLEWDELTPKLDPKRFTASMVLKRVAKRRSDPMAPLLPHHPR